MVDSIGIKGHSVADRRLAPVASTAPAAKAQPEIEGKPAPASAQTMTQAMAAQAPVDAERVARIRKAIEDGRFPTLPATIADRLLALKLEWNPNE